MGTGEEREGEGEGTGIDLNSPVQLAGVALHVETSFVLGVNEAEGLVTTAVTQQNLLLPSSSPFHLCGCKGSHGQDRS